MTGYNLNEIASKTGGKLIGNTSPIIRQLITDSRNVLSPNDSIFFAIRGDRHDGHKFISELYIKKGLTNFVVDHIDSAWKTYNANFIVVDNTLGAIQKLCGSHRKTFKKPVIGITGSNGKTIVKEWLYQLMHQDKKITRSPKSYNSQIGVPLSVWNLEPDADLAIFEAGISKPGEMERLEEIIKPDIGIITNIGEPHQENFSSTKEKIKEKLLLFKGSKLIIYCKNYEMLSQEIENSKNQKQSLLNWSYNGGSDLHIIEVIKNKGKTIVKGRYNNSDIEICIPFNDAASVENAIHCWLVMLYLGYENNIIKSRMIGLSPVAMRLELKKGTNNCTIINDSYNSDINSLSIALDFLNLQHQHNLKTLILSDILQSGKNETELYIEVSRLIEEKKIGRLIGIGPALFRNAKLFNCEKDFYLSTENFLNQFHSDIFKDEAILVKGSRSFGFENITSLLEQKTHRTVLEIYLGAIVHNLNYFKSKLKPGTKVVAMVKAFSYGSGSYEIASLLEYHKVDYLAVAFADEGVALRQAGISLPIIVMNPEEAVFKQMLEYNLEPEIYSFGELRRFTIFLKNNHVENFPVHLKIDSGMHRLGFVEPEIESLCSELKENKYLSIKSVFSHLAASDEPQHDGFTLLQVKNFEQISKKIIDALDYPIYRHILNSMGVERFPEAQFEMVRLGIGLYGINPFNQGKLRNVSTLKTIISQIKIIEKGETIGYSRKGKANVETKIAILPIGYADGFDRKLGNGFGKVWINGQFAPIIGNICMDMCMADISNINAKEGDEVEIFGDHVPISDIAKQIGTIPYEILTGISNRVKRIYFQE
jgi:alanine racemase